MKKHTRQCCCYSANPAIGCHKSNKRVDCCTNVSVNGGCAEYEWVCQLDVTATRESLLQLSIEIYQLAADWSPKVKQVNCDWWTSVVKRRGNALNELGVVYLNQAAALLSESGESRCIILYFVKILNFTSLFIMMHVYALICFSHICCWLYYFNHWQMLNR